MIGVHDAEGAIEFYKKALGAEESGERYSWEGKIGHAELKIGDALLMLADEFPEHNKSPMTLGGTPVILHLTVDDTDAWVKRAVAAGAEALTEVSDQDYGRVGKIRDPFGHIWMLNGPRKN